MVKWTGIDAALHFFSSCKKEIVLTRQLLIDDDKWGEEL